MHEHHQHQHAHGAATGSGELSFADKLVKRLEHWVHHNDDHLEAYRQWAADAERQGHADVAQALAEVVALSEEISAKFRQALQAAQAER